MLDVGGLALCVALVGADYGSTVVALRRPGVVEVGPIARHSLPLGAAVKGIGCLGVEAIGRKQSKKARWVRRGIEAGLTAGIVGWNLTRRPR